MVGYIGYDAVRRLERLPELTVDDLQLPELVDAARHRPRRARPPRGHRSRSSPTRSTGTTATSGSTRPTTTRSRRLDRMTAEPAHARPPPTVAVYDRPKPQLPRRRTPGGAHRRRRDAPRRPSAPARRFQVVLSQRFEIDHRRRPARRLPGAARHQPQPVHVPAAARRLRHRRLQPRVAGHGPRRPGDHAPDRGHPVAWRRPRRRTRCWRRTCSADEKERAEHVMLVDLGRNDLGRVCKPGSRARRRLLPGRAVQPRHAHRLDGDRRSSAEGKTAFDAVAACFPAGTLSGAPKPRAMELIEELEPTRRGLYGGVVGYLDFAGDADTAIAIRTALMRDGIAYVQAGGGNRGRLRPGRRGRRVRATRRARCSPRSPPRRPCARRPTDRMTARRTPLWMSRAAPARARRPRCGVPSRLELGYGRRHRGSVPRRSRWSRWPGSPGRSRSAAGPRVVGASASCSPGCSPGGPRSPAGWWRAPGAGLALLGAGLLVVAGVRGDPPRRAGCPRSAPVSVALTRDAVRAIADKDMWDGLSHGEDPTVSNARMNAERGPGNESPHDAGLASLWREGAGLVTDSTCDRRRRHYRACERRCGECSRVDHRRRPRGSRGARGGAVVRGREGARRQGAAAAGRRWPRCAARASA